LGINKPDAPQRFWRLFGSAIDESFQAWEVDAHGVTETMTSLFLGPEHHGQTSRELAEADGAASGLPNWEGKS